MNRLLESPPVLGLELAGTLMTPEEFDAVEEYDENYRYELINGVLIVTSVPLPMETGPNEMLGYFLLAYQQGTQGGLLDGTLPEQYVRTPRGRRRADRLIWTGLGRVPNRKQDVPTVAVEFVSESRRDRLRDYEEKRGDYRAAGIQEYWIIDRFRRTMTVIRNRAGGKEELIIGESETYRPDLLPGFELDVGKLLAVADHWAEAE